MARPAASRGRRDEQRQPDLWPGHDSGGVRGGCAVGHAGEAAESGAGLDGSLQEYLPAAAAFAARAWGLSINSDYVYPETEGERPANFAMSRAMAATLRKLADEDLEFRMLRYRLVHMVDPDNVLREGPLAIRFFTALQGSMAS